MWIVLRKYGLVGNIIRALEQLHAKSMSKVRVGAKLSENLPCSVGVRQWCILSPVLFDFLLKDIVSRTVEAFTGSV